MSLCIWPQFTACNSGTIMVYVLYNIPLNLDRQEMKLILDYSPELLLSLSWLSAHTLTKSTGEELWYGDESVQKANKSPEGLRPCKSCTWARGRWSIIHWEKEKGIEKKQTGEAVEAVEEGEGLLRHAAVTFQHDIWRMGDSGRLSHSFHLSFPARCEWLKLKAECSHVYSTSAAAYGRK